jgi:transcriptional regulator with XRE-family HTH domain
MSSKVNVIIDNIINFAASNFNKMETAINNIKAILKEQNMSQSDLADKCGMAAGTINRIIRGKQKLTQNTLKLIADVLNVSIDELSENVSILNNGVNGYLQFGNEITHITSYRSLLNWLKKYEPLIIGLPQMAKNIQKEERRNQGPSRNPGAYVKLSRPKC